MKFAIIVVAAISIGSTDFAKPSSEGRSWPNLRPQQTVVPLQRSLTDNSFGADVRWELPDNLGGIQLWKIVPDSLPKKVGIPSVPDRIKVTPGVDGSDTLRY